MPRIKYAHHYEVVSSSNDIVTTVGQAPIGLMLLVETGEIICKSEYKRTDGQCECTIVDSGEYYWGKGDSAPCLPIELVLKEDMK